MIGFENGVFDLNTQTFRPGNPEDYVTYSTGYNFSYCDKQSTNYIDMMNCICQILPNRAVRDYVLKFLASCLRGEIRDHIVPIWIGKGSNGKSVLITLMEKCLGDYAGTLPTSLITQSRAKSNQASPELSDHVYKRLCIFSEPDTNDKLNSGLLKQLSGGDKIAVRGLFQDQKEVNPHFHLAIITNVIPSMPSNDGGLYRRIRIIDFPSRFVDKPDPTKPNEYQLDCRVQQKVSDWSNEFMNLLLEHYVEYRQAGVLNAPDEVLEATKQRQEANDTIGEFIKDRIVECPGAYVKIQRLYSVYREWSKEQAPSGFAPKRNELREYFETRFEFNSSKGFKRYCYYNGTR